MEEMKKKKRPRKVKRQYMLPRGSDKAISKKQWKRPTHWPFQEKPARAIEGKTKKKGGKKEEKTKRGRCNGQVVPKVPKTAEKRGIMYV